MPQIVDAQHATHALGPLAAMELARDKRLAERDTRRWCLDRCMATGYCDAVENLWDMSSK